MPEITLREFLTQRINQMEDRLDRDREGLREQTQREQALVREQALDARATLEKRLDEMNLLRRQIEQERNLYVTRDRLDQEIRAVENRIEAEARASAGRWDELGERVAEAARARANLDGRFTVIGMVMVGLSVLLQIAFGFLKGLITK